MIRARHTAAGYFLKLRHCLDGADYSVTLKFDTGADCSIITLDTLLSDRNVERSRIVDKLKKKYAIYEFMAATGDKMHGFLTKLENVVLAGVRLREFYFYLIVDAKKKTALLGDDFISCCTFSHAADDDIIVSAFNANMYKQKAFNDYLDANEIAEILAESVSDQDPPNSEIIKKVRAL